MSGGSFNYLCWKGMDGYQDHSLKDFINLIVYCMKHEVDEVKGVGYSLLQDFYVTVEEEAKKKEPMIDFWRTVQPSLKAIEWEASGDCGAEEVLAVYDNIYGEQ
ncbi:MAG: hypothetical protein JSW00_04015 [Thermoplasmata archaeon]|nr:MAG: hypothetical protein JSW00_04015 [Thermoplasmata archaeon]